MDDFDFYTSLVEKELKWAITQLWTLILERKYHTIFDQSCISPNLGQHLNLNQLLYIALFSLPCNIDPRSLMRLNQKYRVGAIYQSWREREREREREWEKISPKILIIVPRFRTQRKGKTKLCRCRRYLIYFTANQRQLLNSVGARIMLEQETFTFRRIMLL